MTVACVSTPKRLWLSADSSQRAKLINLRTRRPPNAETNDQLEFMKGEQLHRIEKWIFGGKEHMDSNQSESSE